MLWLTQELLVGICRPKSGIKTIGCNLQRFALSGEQTRKNPMLVLKVKALFYLFNCISLPYMLSKVKFYHIWL